jgi:hypothetical protein
MKNVGIGVGVGGTYEGLGVGPVGPGVGVTVVGPGTFEPLGRAGPTVSGRQPASIVARRRSGRTGRGRVLIAWRG